MKYFVGRAGASSRQSLVADTRKGRLQGGVSRVALALALTVAGGALFPAHAANYTASNETELFAAIDDANADGAASSTITLTGSFSIPNPSAMPAITKALTIDAAGYNVTTPTNLGYNVAAGATLVVKGDIDGTGFLAKGGAGALVINGTGSHYTRDVKVLEGELRVENGGQISAGNAVDGGVWVSGNNASLVINGASSMITANGGGRIGSAQGSVMIVENGAAYSAPGVTVANVTNEIGTLTVRGAGSTLDATSQVATFQGTGFINVLDGAVLTSTTGGLGGSGAILGAGGTGTAVISGAGSRWTTSSHFGVHDGSLSILDGGRMETTYFRAGINAASGGRALQGHILVSGAGSELLATGVQQTIVGSGGTGSLTVADGGKVSITGGARTLQVASAASGKGTVNIGGAAGQAATSAGTLDIAILAFGAGNGTLNFNHTDASYAFDIALASGTGTSALNHLGSGKTVLTDDQVAFTGLSTVYAGILEVDGALGGLMDVRGGRLQGTGSVGDTSNYAGGTIAPGNSIGTLTVAGDYTSEGGALEVEAELGDDSSPTDLLVVTGNSLLGAGGATQVRVINLGGLGAQTTGDGIRIVEVQGATSDAGAFALSGPAIGGVYRYDLFQHDLMGTLDDGDWYLRSTGLAPTLPTYESYPVVLLGLMDLPTLRQRVGDRQELYAGGEAAGQAASGVWTRIEAAHARVEGDSTLGLSYDSNRYLIQAGIDGQFLDAGSSSLLAGVNFQYGRDSADIASSVGDGRNGTDSFGAGATLTWYGADGFYVDGQAQAAALRSKLSADEIGSIEDKLKGVGYALGIEAGRSFGLRDGWALTPQAQLVYTAVDFDDFTDPFGAEVSLRDGDSLKGRLGVALERETAGGSYYGLANLTYEFLDGTSVDVSGEAIDFTPDAFAAELGVGGNYAWAGGKYALYGEALVRSSFEGSYGVKGTVGLTSRF